MGHECTSCTMMNMAVDNQGAEKPASIWYMIALVSFSLGTGVMNFCLITALQATLKPLTSSAFVIGMMTVMISMNTIWATPYALWKSDRIWTRYGRRKPIVMLMGPPLVVTLLLIPHCHSLWLMGTVVFLTTIALSSVMGLIQTAIGDSIPDKQRPLATGMWHFTANGLAGFLMARYVLGLMDPGLHRVGGGWLTFGLNGAGHWPYTVAAIVSTLTSSIFLLVFREHYVEPRAAEKFRLFSYGKQIVRVREHLLIYVILLFQPLFVLVGSWYFPTLAAETLKMSKAQYGHAQSWGGMIVMISCVPLGILFNHLRHRRAFTVAACLMAIVPITWGLFFMKTAAGIAFYFAAQQFAFSIFRLNFSPYITEYTTPRCVGTVFGVANSVNGIIRTVMVLISGVLIDLMGKNYRLPLWGGYVGVVVCVICLLMMRPPEKVRHLLDAGESV